MPPDAGRVTDALAPADASRWARICAIFDLASDHAEEAWKAIVAREAAGDAALQDAVLRLLTAERADPFRLERPRLVVKDREGRTEQGDGERVGQIVGHYRLERLVGRGGMGAVYEGTRADAAYHQRVAVKLLHPQLGHRGMAARFRRERQILAALEHPNIARLLDGGTTAQGEPFLVMEYVEGTPITAYCDAQRLPIPERLQLLLQACAAVQHAHGRLVVHRDLKPANILVTAEGRVTLLDFGVAKLLAPTSLPGGLDGSEATVTQLGRPLTPEYASPEQLRDEPASLASDVYSLGVILYELLAGRRPYTLSARSSAAALRAQEATIPRPSTVVTLAAATERGEPSLGRLRHRLAGELDNIVRKALQQDPARRYPSVEALAHDIRRYLEGRPVLAQPDSAGYRLRKFVRRNPLAAGAMAALFLVLAGGIVATTWQAHIANQARRAAERRFRDAHTLAMSLISDVNDSIARLPGATRTRHFLVARALGALDTLAQHAQDARDDRDIQYDLAVAYIKAGDLQGKPTISNLGETNAALDSYNKARVMLASLATTHPIDTRVERQLALADERISAIYHRAHDRVHSEHYARLAIAIDEALVHADPANESDQEALATSLISLGDALAASNEEWSVARSRAARDSYARALAIYQMLAARGPMTPAVQRGLLIGYTRLGYAGAWTWAATHDVAELRTALARHLQSQRLRRALLAADPGSASNQRLVADGWMDVAQAQRVLGDIPHALASYDSAGPLFQSLAAVDGTNIEARRDLAYYHENFGHALADAHQLARAIQHERTAVAILSALQRADPADNEDYWHICHAQDVVAHALEGLGAEASARAAYGDLITTLQGWITAEPDNVQGHRMLRDARARLAALTP